MEKLMFSEEEKKKEFRPGWNEKEWSEMNRFIRIRLKYKTRQ